MLKMSLSRQNNISDFGLLDSTLVALLYFMFVYPGLHSKINILIIHDMKVGDKSPTE